MELNVRSFHKVVAPFPRCVCLRQPLLLSLIRCFLSSKATGDFPDIPVLAENKLDFLVAIAGGLPAKRWHDPTGRPLSIRNAPLPHQLREGQISNVEILRLHDR